MQSASFSPAAQAPTGNLSAPPRSSTWRAAWTYLQRRGAHELTTQPFIATTTTPIPTGMPPRDAAQLLFQRGEAHRLLWRTARCAVSSVMMRSALENEFVLDPFTRLRNRLDRDAAHAPVTFPDGLPRAFHSACASRRGMRAVHAHRTRPRRADAALVTSTSAPAPHEPCGPPPSSSFAATHADR